MSRPIKDLTLNEGFTDLGMLDVEITSVEQVDQGSGPVTVQIKEDDPRNLLFKLQFDDDAETPVPMDYKAVFTVNLASGEDTFTYERFPDLNGYVEFNGPLLPTKIVDAAGIVIQLSVDGPVTSRFDECYLRFNVSGGYGYTQIANLVIDAGILKIKDGATLYSLSPSIDIASTTALYITNKGKIYRYSSSNWVLAGTLTFFQMQYPEELTVISDGFYSSVGRPIGTTRSGNLGQAGTSFEDFRATLINPDKFDIKFSLDLYDANAAHVGSTVNYTGVMPGSLNVRTAEFTMPAAPADSSPTITAVAALVSGFSFSGPFVTFLETATGISPARLDSIRKLGPMKYAAGYPFAPDSDVTEVTFLQSHVDLYQFTDNISQSQKLIDKGYGGIYKISQTSKKQFLDDVTTGSNPVPLFKGASVHETIVQGQKYLTSRLAGTLGDYRMVSSPTPDVAGSSYKSKVLSSATSVCGCSDCQSGVSPFAYLMDLLKYASEHLDYTTAYNHGIPDIQAFIDNFLVPDFQQPFGALNVDCDTLHDEYCRVRLVTEILQRKLGGLSAQRQQAFDASKADFLMQVYQNLLLRLSTSWTEMRNFMAMPAGTARDEAEKKLCGKIGIPTQYWEPLPAPGSNKPTLNRLWLTVGGGGMFELNADNLQLTFGYRSTETSMSQITPTPKSAIEQWKDSNLREVWRSQDYPYTNYTREGVTPGIPASYKSNWLPTIDPDIIGWEDMTYAAGTLAKQLWTRRKEDTDAFLSAYNNAAVMLRTSADMNGRSVKVVDRNISAQVFESDKISLEQSAGTWVDFTVFSKTLTGTDTLVVLQKITPSTPEPNMFQPYYNSSLGAPQMRYRKVVPVTAGQVTSSTTANLTWTSPTIVDRYTTGTPYAKLYSTGDGTTFVTGTNLTVTYTSETAVTLTLGTTPNSNFINGNIYFVYEVIVPLYSTLAVDSETMVNRLFTSNENYTPLSPPCITTAPYTVWNLGGTWPSGFSGLSKYEKLLTLFNKLSNGTATDDYGTAVTDNLHMSLSRFNRMMQLFLAEDNFMKGMYTAPRLTEEEIWELADIFRSSGKTVLRYRWIQEETEYKPTVGSPYSKLKLDKSFFWKSLSEPLGGTWGPSLQTLVSGTPILDPELLAESDLLNTPEAAPYRNLYATRKNTLATAYTSFYNRLLSPFNVTGFIGILNEVNTGLSGSSPYTPSYSISPYSQLSDLVSDLRSADPFKKKKAADAAWAAFAIGAEDFLYVAEKKELFELNDPGLMPNNVDIDKALKLLVSGYKRKRLYPNFTSPAYTGWVTEEISGSSTFPAANTPVYYYNVRSMRLSPVLGDVFNRVDWHNTLEKWNRSPIVNPDIVPPEYILNFASGDPIYTAWTTRKQLLSANYSTLAGYIRGTSITTSQLFTNFKDQIDLIIGRSTSFTPTGTQSFLPYFINLMDLEDKKEDISSRLEQYGILITEYKYLRKIYEVLKSTSVSTPPLLSSEYDDIINIFIAIRSRNLNAYQVVDDFEDGILLSQDGFVLYKPMAIGFQQSAEPKFNPWRSPQSVRKDWEDTLQTRIDREAALHEKWKSDVEEVEEFTMPLMRDALITAMCNNNELFDDAAERLAKTLLIETKDNCCVKHTRVSFAIETMQQFLYSLNNGIFANFISNYKLVAPYFTDEWQWLGSYATWRSAMFVYYYPENLLYPTLKRLQSPGFQTLARSLSEANRMSPEQACDKAKDFQEYLTDIENLKVCCSTNADSWNVTSASTGCCEEQVKTKSYTAFYFGQGPSGKSYWSYKLANINSPNSTNFWFPVDTLRRDANLLGCYALCERFDWQNWTSEKPALWLFYTYYEKGALKMAYVTKDLENLNSSWSSENSVKDLPQIEYNGAKNDITQVMAAQHDYDMIAPLFVVTFRYNGQNMHSICSFNKQSGECGVEKIFNTQSNKYEDFAIAFTDPLVCAIRHNNQVGNALNGGYDILSCVTLISKHSVFTFFYGDKAPKSYSGSTNPLYFASDNILGGFEDKESLNSVVIYCKNSSGNFKAMHIDMTANWSSSVNGQVVYSQQSTSISQFGNGVTQIDKIYPIFTQRKEKPLFIVKAYASKSIIATPVRTTLASPYGLHMTYQLSLTPESSPFIAVESADCTPDLDARALSIKTKLLLNTTQPTSNSQSLVIRTTAVKELLYEAYYSVPLLLALDQQQRGQYPSALSWYQSIYNYNENLTTKRKIFYGLILEDSQHMNTVFQQSSNWLLDPLNPHLIAKSRANAFTKYTLMNIVQCLYGYADRLFTNDTIETVPLARKYYSLALDLMKTSELQVIENTCENTAVSELDTNINTTAKLTSPEWSGMYNKMVADLSSYGDESKTQAVATSIIGIFNSSTPDYSIDTRFKDAFYQIELQRPVNSSKTVLVNMKDTATKVDNNFRFLSALDKMTSLKSGISNDYAQSVADVSWIDVNDLVSEAPAAIAKVEWLKTALPSSDKTYSFSFTNNSGDQTLSKGQAYNPLAPSNMTFYPNVGYSNAPVFVPYYSANAAPYTYVPLMGFGFCMPPNPVYKNLQLKGNLELYKIFNCRNIAGMVRELSVYAAPTDTVTGIPVIGAGGNLILPGVGVLTPSQYRFKVLIERAKQLVQQSQQLESLFLSALEKVDAENYSQLQAKQGIETAKATVKLQDLRVTQAKDEKTLATLQMNKATFSKQHFDTLIAKGLNGYEIASLALMEVGAALQSQAAILMLGNAIANTATFSATAGKSGSLDFGGSALSTLAGSISSRGSILSQIASYQRREEEWTYQSELAAKDVGIAYQQTVIADDNIRISTQERAIAQLNLDHAQDSLEYLKNKFTNAELYGWMGSILERSYSYMLNLSTSVAKTAERQLFFERQEQAGPFIQDDYWVTSSTSGFAGNTVDRRGLTGSARLLVDITRLDQYAFDSNKRKLQMTKVISLAQNFPSEFQQFRETGVMYFQLTNKQFDYDFPGHYLRLISSVKTSVIGLIPVYDNIKATLTAESISYTVIGGTTFQRIPIRRLELDSVALTSASNATGVFDLQPMQGELLNPFEGMGVESRWEFKMPQFNNRMDLSNVADILISVDYTAFDSYAYRYQVLQELDNKLSFNKGFSFKNDFPDQWFDLAEVTAGSNNFGVTFELKRSDFPQGINDLEINKASDLLLYFVREDGFEDEIEILDFSYVNPQLINNPNNPPTYMNGKTVNGKFSATQLTNILGDSPVVKLQLLFDNTPATRKYFTEGQIKDIILLMPCKAELTPYPL